jgi:hypothetical protein
MKLLTRQGKVTRVGVLTPPTTPKPCHTQPIRLGANSHIPAPKPNVYNFTNTYVSGDGALALGFETFINAPAATWVIPHSLGRRPDVAVYDSGGYLMIADVHSTSLTTTITFATPTTGSAVLS